MNIFFTEENKTKVDQALANLKATLNPSPGFDNVLQKHIDQTNDNIHLLRIAIKKNDRYNIVTIAHRMKGGAQMLDAEQLILYCSTLELKSHILSCHELKTNYLLLCREWRILTGFINKHLSLPQMT